MMGVSQIYHRVMRDHIQELGQVQRLSTQLFVHGQ
jgi:hypothetical protein